MRTRGYVQPSRAVGVTTGAVPSVALLAPEVGLGATVHALPVRDVFKVHGLVLLLHDRAAVRALQLVGRVRLERVLATLRALVAFGHRVASWVDRERRDASLGRK